MPFVATWTDLHMVIQSEVRQISYALAYVWNLKNGTSELIYKTERVENKPTVTRGERRGGINWETGTDIYTLII